MFLLKPPDLQYSVTVAQMDQDTVPTWLTAAALHLALSFCPGLFPLRSALPTLPWALWAGSCPPPWPYLLPLLALNF